MPDLVKCPKCGDELHRVNGGRLKHNPDGTHAFAPATTPKADAKPRRSRG